MTSHPEARINMVMNAEQIREFFPVLQEGVSVSARVGCPLVQFLCDQLSLDKEYIASRVTTIFMDSKPVDDINTAVVRDGTTIALSGAMPGLVGATMRRGGYYAAMRGSISHAVDTPEGINRIGIVRIKLFNLLMAELGPEILRRGVLIPAPSLAAFFGSRTDSFWKGCSGALYNGVKAGPAFLYSGDPFIDLETIRLYVDFR